PNGHARFFLLPAPATAARPIRRAVVPCFPHPPRAPPRRLAARALRGAPPAVGDPAPTRCGSRAPPPHSSSPAPPETSVAHHTRRRYRPPPSQPAPLRQRPAKASAVPALLWWQTPPHRGCLPRGSAPDPPSTPPAGRALDR